MNIFGLIGKHLSHSLSKKYFENKFRIEKINSKYELFELNNISEIINLLENKSIKGLNVTTPYKEKVIQYLDYISEEAKIINSVNTIKILNNKRYGYNTDVIGFEKTLPLGYESAIILGDGGVSKTVQYILGKNNIKFILISRQLNNNSKDYSNLTDYDILNNKLIINTTILGMYPNINLCPLINYKILTNEHFLYDLIYNPEITLFLKNGINIGTNIKNGIDMLKIQAEESWKIWNNE